jgi:hypothetical protein
MAAQRSRLRDPLGFVSKVGDRLTQTYRLARALPEFFRERITVQQAEEEIKRMLASREERFLELARSRIYGNPASPYLRLLKIAGCEFADLQAHVHRDGLETTLKKLASNGVYLTSDEFKGKKAVARGRESFHVSPEDFQRPDSPPGYAAQSSGTRNRPVRSLRPLDWLALRTFGLCIFFSAHNLFSYSHAVYEAILPGTGGVGRLLHYAKLGIHIDRWFARRVPATGWLERSHHYVNTYLIVGMGKLYGPGVPRPEFIDPGDTQRIVYWILEQQRAGHACCVTTVSSSAARIARMAWKMGASLEGTVFDITGEPFTEAKERTIKQVGAFVTSRYAYGGGIPAGYGCASPVEKDEVHVNQYILAMIPHPRPLNDHDGKIQPLLLTTLHLAAPTLLLNVENGDYATFLRRDCGCALERVGLKLHLHHIRSYEKFTSEGMNYFYGDLYELFEKILPAEFGGGPGDYQLVEEEDENGQTRITLRVHPEAGEIDQEKLGARLREAMGRGSWGNEFQARVWEGAGTLRIKREVPFASARGKILPLQIKKS